MKSYIPDELVEEIRMNNDIADVVSEYVKLEKRGANFFGLCPFHKEKTPSFSVAPAKQIFYCFGCGKGGNVIQFVMNAENLDYVEALRFLADRARIQLPEGDSSEEQERAKQKQEIIKVNVEAARFFFNNLNSSQNEEPRQYLKNRAISEKTIRKFGIGYSGEEWDSLYKHLLGMGFEQGSIVNSGLVIPKKSGGYVDRFRGRVMFPIFDIRGNILGFGGRVLDASVPKYMNSPETLAYNKGRNLYALNFAKGSGEKRIIIVEGYMDVISLHQSGIINTVASLGTALTESQGRILKKYSEEIIISYDADTAGQAATMRGLDLLNDIGCNVKVLQIPEGKDPDEFVKKNGAEEFKKLVSRAMSLIEYKIKVLKNQIETDTTEGKIKFLNKIADVLSKLDNSLEREMYIKKLAKEYEITEEAIYSEVYKRIRPKAGFREIVSSPKEIVRKTGSDSDEGKETIHDEMMLLALLCTDNSIYKSLSDKINVAIFNSDRSRRVAEVVLERLGSNKGIVAGELLSICGEDDASEFSKIIQEECNCEDKRKAVLDIIKRIELFRLKKRQKEILELLKSNGGQIEGDVEKLKREFKTLEIMIKERKNA